MNILAMLDAEAGDMTGSNLLIRAHEMAEAKTCGALYYQSGKATFEESEAGYQIAYAAFVADLAIVRYAVAELIDAVSEDLRMRSLVPKYTPDDLQKSCERVSSALANLGAKP